MAQPTILATLHTRLVLFPGGREVSPLSLRRHNEVVGSRQRDSLSTIASLVAGCREAGN